MGSTPDYGLPDNCLQAKALSSAWMLETWSWEEGEGRDGSSGRAHRWENKLGNSGVDLVERLTERLSCMHDRFVER